ncbi:MAG: hypothetical protein HYV42_04430 [Candidatus Magasanikbacteria bacterium]|nr:hypothetical protein [Candidatus Magasanikbacteria bacterium]
MDETEGGKIEVFDIPTFRASIEAFNKAVGAYLTEIGTTPVDLSRELLAAVLIKRLKQLNIFAANAEKLVELLLRNEEMIPSSVFTGLRQKLETLGIKVTEKMEEIRKSAKKIIDLS